MHPQQPFSPVIAGTMNWGQWGSRFNTQDYLKQINTCLELGISTFDHADIYGHYTTEEEFGNALALHTGLRKDLQLISKCGIRMVTANRPEHKIKSYDTSALHVIQSVERSLTNLRTDYLDLLLLHRPDPLMDPDEIATAFTKLKESGKVLHFGVSNFSPSQCLLIQSRYPLLANQIELSILHLDPFTNGTLDHCLNTGLIPMAWGPLGSGRLFMDDGDDRNKRVLAMAQLLSDQYQRSPEQILISWLLTHPSGILPILGTSKPERLKAAIEIKDFRLTREEWYLLWRASTGKEVP
jgi:predicted oxidoreductase